MLAVIGSIAGLVMLLYENIQPKQRLSEVYYLSFLFSLPCFSLPDLIRQLVGKLLTAFGPQNSIAPEVFQSFNPLFIVALTFPVMGAFAWMNKKGIEPSTPKKIGIGMVIAAIGFIIILDCFNRSSITFIVAGVLRLLTPTGYLHTGLSAVTLSLLLQSFS